MQLSLFYEDTDDELLKDLFTAYFNCRKNKRNKNSSLEFEKHFESNVFKLYDDVITGRYKLSSSIAFVVTKPVRREVFAADFRDRVIHHFLIDKLNSIFETLFHPNSFACRVSKGTHYGIRSVREDMERVSDNYTKEAWLLKLDVKGFFMHINRDILNRRLMKLIFENYKEKDKELIMRLVSMIVTHDSTSLCVVKGAPSDWVGLPPDKSLFHSPENCGIPIGNLTSQVFANFYLHSLDMFVTQDLGIGAYGRYVDDFYMISRDKEYLKLIIPKIKHFLRSDLCLTLHPKKIYLQEVKHGVPFLGTYIKPGRTYVGNRIKSGFYESIQAQNIVIRAICRNNSTPSEENFEQFISTMNSYLGLMRHFSTFRLRERMLNKYLSRLWYRFVTVDQNINKFTVKFN
jgi:RNA-directed DNA polymerase